MDPPQFKEMTKQSPMNSVPMWVDEEGFAMNGANAILRTLGIRCGYYTDDPMTAWAIDSLVDFADSQ